MRRAAGAAEKLAALCTLDHSPLVQSYPGIRLFHGCGLATGIIEIVSFCRPAAGFYGNGVVQPENL